MEKEVLEEYISLFEKVAHKSANLEELQKKYEPNSVFDDLEIWELYAAHIIAEYLPQKIDVLGEEDERIMNIDEWMFSSAFLFEPYWIIKYQDMYYAFDFEDELEGKDAEYSELREYLWEQMVQEIAEELGSIIDEECIVDSDEDGNSIIKLCDEDD
jgi:hypothetical protein